MTPETISPEGTPTDTDIITRPDPPLKPKRRLPNFWIMACVLLLIGLAVSIFLWKPWQANIKASDRTVTVSGDSTVTAEPDEYVFSPSYTFKNTSKNAALADMTKKSDEIVSQIKKLGVADNKIKTNSNGYSNGVYFPEIDNGQSTYTLRLTVTLNDKTLAQKVQDYLVTTAPTGSVSPDVNFSTDKQKQLENQARDKAEKDAHDKAAQSAKNLGFSLGKVKSIQDGNLNSRGGCLRGLCVNELSNGANVSAQSTQPSLSVQPGENELDYSVNVVYYIH